MQHLCALILGLLTPVAALGAAIRSYAPGRSSYKSATPVYQTGSLFLVILLAERQRASKG